MDKQIILAVAGSGKTYHICNSIDPDRKNLIIAYTNENIKNIRKELNKAYGRVPELTNVMTFDSFVYRYLLLPYEPSILIFFGNEGFKSRGVTIQDPPPMRVTGWNGKMYANKYYCQKERVWTLCKQFRSILLLQLI